MLVLDCSKSSGKDDVAHTVAIFGVGLVGQSVASCLSARTSAARKHLPFTWEAGSLRQQQIDSIEHALFNTDHASLASQKPTSIVWSAGAAGFSADQDVLNAEAESLGQVIALCKRLHARGARLSFHLLSSAGGLFEGQRDVDTDTAPRPLRPYSAAKLVHEEMVRALPQGVISYIYRPSTIYGYHRGGRPGLIITLIRNGYQRRTTRIFGSLDTMRDYVHVSDIGRFICDQILYEEGNGGTFLLACGKPTSMRSITLQVEEIIGQPLYLQFDPSPSNAQHNTYRPFAAKNLKNATPLQYGIKLSALEWYAGEFGRRQ